MFDVSLFCIKCLVKKKKSEMQIAIEDALKWIKSSPYFVIELSFVKFVALTLNDLRVFLSVN